VDITKRRKIMTNREKFKTAEERAIAFRKFCANKICKGLEANCIFSDRLHERIKHKCEFAWLELEAEEELLPCPFCGGKASVSTTTDVIAMGVVSCNDCNCHIVEATEEAAFAAWNRRV
jgi:Lar family restriction alleviation protein